MNFGFNQAEIIEGHRRELICAGQTAIDADGTPQHEGDMRSHEALTHYEVLRTRLGQTGVSPPMTLLGINRFAFRELMIELEATAVD
ncbi:MAG: RidA family protein [Gammaproteobacteria bacterium]